MENRKFEYRSVIKFLVLEGESATNIHERLTAVYGDDAPSRTTVFEWARRFKDGQFTIEDDPRSGRPVTATDDQTIAAVERLVVEDRRISIQQLSDILDVSAGALHSV